jgi:hypothetical protein
MRLRAAFAAALAFACGIAEPVEAQDAEVDPRSVLQAAVEKLIELAPNLRSVDVAGFAGQGGHSLCGTALTEALFVALDEEARNPNRVLRDKPLTVRRAGGAAPRPDGEAAAAIGSFEVDARGRAFMSLAFRQGDAVLAPSGRVPVALEKLACDPTLRPFLDHVAAGARLDRETLDLTAPVFTTGQRLEVSIAVRRPLRLLCWVLAEDGTGFVTLQPGGADAAMKPGTYRYPRDFRLDEIVLASRFENLFACFGAEKSLPDALEAAWRRFAPSVGRDAALIDAETVRALMQEARATPGVSEATARVVVR